MSEVGDVSREPGAAPTAPAAAEKLGDLGVSSVKSAGPKGPDALGSKTACGSKNCTPGSKRWPFC